MSYGTPNGPPEFEPGDPGRRTSGPSNRQLGYLAIAALVVVVIAVIIIVVSNTGSSNSNTSQNADASDTGHTPGVTSTPAKTGTVARAPTTTTVATSPASGGALTPAGGPVPTGFQPGSFTALSHTLWWVMGSASCSSPPCTSIVRTADGGKTWVGIPAPRSSGVTTLRFADQKDGFAYGDSQLWTTHDGGAQWNRVAVGGSVNSLAASGNDVFVATSQGLLRSPVGSDAFEQIEAGDIASVWAQGSSVWVDSQTSSGTSALLSSSDGGASFQQYAAPQYVVACDFESTGAPVVWAPCATGTEGSVWRSTDGGAQWDAEDPTAGGEGEPNSAPFAAASASTALYGATQLYRTTDDGQTWAAVSGFPSSGETITYLGFTDASHGVAILNSQDASSESSSSLYVTDDGGVSFTPVTIQGG